MIDRLEDLIENGRRMPLGGRALVDAEAFRNVIDQMRIAMPQEIRQAREIVQEGERYLARSQEEARRLLEQAREDAARQLDQDLLHKDAEQRAESIVHAAEADAERIRTGADEYAAARLRELADYVSQLQRVLDNGLQALDHRQATAPQGQAQPAEGAAAATESEEDAADSVGGDGHIEVITPRGRRKLERS